MEIVQEHEHANFAKLSDLGLGRRYERLVGFLGELSAQLNLDDFSVCVLNNRELHS